MLPLLIAFVVILGVAGVYTGEYTSKMHGILLTTKNGRSELFGASYWQVAYLPQ